MTPAPQAFDVVVVGGGPAGIAAAVAAARGGAHTLLVERSDVLGGNAGNALVHTICGLYLPASEGPAEYAHSGFPVEFAEMLLRSGAAAAVERAGRVHVLPTYPHLMRAAALEMCSSTERLTVSLDSKLVAAAADPDGFDLRVRRAGGELPLRAAIGIDTSGDANLAAAVSAGCEMEQPDDLQNPSFIFRVGGVDPRQTEGFARMRLTNTVARAERQSELPPGAGSVLLRPGPGPGEAYITLNVAKPDEEPYAPLDAGALVRLTDRARSAATALVAFLRDRRAGFGTCEIVEWPRCIGVRETRRVVGVERMEAADLLSGRKRDDEVALSTWPIEIWKDHRGARFEYPSGPSSIPLGALVSRDNPRLGMAGRCMSASHEALGALRVIGTALATGEAIGRAAASSVDGGVDLAASLPS